MRYWLIVLLSLLIGCSGELRVTSYGRLLYKSRDQQLSCYTGSNSDGTNCCYPYNGKVMICAAARIDGVGNEGASITIRVVPSNK